MTPGSATGSRGVTVAGNTCGTSVDRGSGRVGTRPPGPVGGPSVSPMSDVRLPGRLVVVEPTRWGGNGGCPGPTVLTTQGVSNRPPPVRSVLTFPDTGVLDTGPGPVPSGGGWTRCGRVSGGGRGKVLLLSRFMATGTPVSSLVVQRSVDLAREGFHFRTPLSTSPRSSPLLLPGVVPSFLSYTGLSSSSFSSPGPRPTSP